MVMSTETGTWIIHIITCYNAFTKRGFTWGGSWKSIKDYQHFEKSIE
ncbi:MAG: hypothetical protein K0S61_3184 [Anaerocolumna sp.]|nr:hypothetical protein [Anaerocolumna sp.]